MWVDSIIKAKIRIDSLGGTEDWNGARMIVRGDATGDTFFTVGLWAGGDEVRIEKATNLTFTQMKADHQGSPAAAPFPIEIGKTYELTVVVDHSTIYCYIDGEFVLMAQEPDFTTQPFGQVGFFTNGAAATFSDVSVAGIKGITNSPFTPSPANPLNIVSYAPAIVKDDSYHLWDAFGRYATSEDGITWSRPLGDGNVVMKSPTGNWPVGNNFGDPDALKIGDEYITSFWSHTVRRNGAFDGMGLKRSTDLENWTDEPGNPVFYMGPYGDWDENVVGDHAMIKDGDLFKMWHVGINRAERGFRNEFGYAESPDAVHWRKCRLNPVLTQGKPGTWDGGWIYAAGVIKVDDDLIGPHVYAGKPGASYHLFYTGQPSNNEWVAGVKRIGYAFSLDGIHWVKWNDPATTEPPFHDSDPVVTWSDYGQKGFLGVGAATALRVGDEVRIYHSMYDDRPDTVRPEAVIGLGFATVKIEKLRQIVEDAKKVGLLTTSPRAEIDALMDEPIPQSMWDDLQAKMVEVIQSRTAGDTAKADAAMKTITATRATFTKALEAYLAGTLTPLKTVLERLDAGKPMSEKLLWSLPADAPRTPVKAANNVPSFEINGLSTRIAGDVVLIEFQAGLDRYEVARVAWATDGEFRPGDVRDVIIGYPSGETLPTYRVPVSTKGKTITGLRITFPLNSEPDLKTLALREITTTP